MRRDRASERKKPAEEQNNRNDRNDTVIAFHGVRKRFIEGSRHITAIDGLSLKVLRSAITGLVGPDGAGKTTLMRLCTGIVQPDEGSVTVLGMDTQRRALDIQSRVGYMPQQFGLYEDLTVNENLQLYADLQGIPRQERPEKIDRLMEMTRLEDFIDRLAGHLSGGMKQKLGLACTMVRSPDILILDEPTAGVDPVSRRDLWRIIRELVADEGLTVLVSTAYLDETEQCREVVMLRQGKMLNQDNPAKVSREQENKTYHLTAPGMKKRELQQRLSVSDEVLDSVIQGEGVRLVLKNDTPPDPEALGIEDEDVTIEAVSPRFEDGYVAILSQEKEEQTFDPSADEDATKIRTAKTDETVIDVNKAARRFGDFYAVKQISFQVSRGEIFGLLGANGAGKTTTFRMICGLLPPSEGTLHVAGYDLRTAAAKARSKIGYMSQKFSLYGQLSVSRNLDFFSSAYNLKGKQKRRQVERALHQFNLVPVAGAVSGELPLGYKQRLALACSLMHDPDILFLDEPTSGVDPLARREFWRYINRLADRGVTVMVTTHFMEEAEYCDRLVLLVAGEIIARGSSLDIKKQAKKEGNRSIRTMEDAFITLIERSNASSEKTT